MLYNDDDLLLNSAASDPGNRSDLPGQDEQKEAGDEIDIRALAKEIYALMVKDLMIEMQRLGRRL
jgi:hypothetical protein